MKYFVILIAMLVCISYTSMAQPIEPDLLKRLKGKTKLTEIMKVVEKYYADEKRSEKRDVKEQDEPEENSYLHWKRWEWYMQTRLDKDGNFVNISERLLHVIEEQKPQDQQREAQATNAVAGSTTSVWSLIGPTSVTGGNANQLSGIGRADRIAFHPTDPNIIYLGAPAGGLWKTTNAGTNWYPVAGFLPGLSVSGIVVDHQNPNTIYVLTGDGNASLPNYFTSIYGFTRQSAGLFKSIDGGQNFERMPPLPTTVTTYFGYKLVQDPTFNNVLLAATTNGLFRSNNYGATWTRPIADPVFDVEFKPNGAGTTYASTSSGVSISTDYGANFNTASNFNFSVFFSIRIELAVTPSNPNVVYALAGDGGSLAGSFKGVFKSTNSGINFTRQCNTPNILGRNTGGGDANEQNIYNLGIAVSPSDENNVLTCGLTVWRSTNSGASFVFSTTYAESFGAASQYIHPDVHDIAFNPLNNWLYAASDGGFYRSTNNGISWQDLSLGFATTQIYHMGGFEGNNSLVSIGCQDNGVRARKFNNGNFEAVLGGDGFDVAYSPANSGISYVTTNGGIVKALTSGTLSGTTPSNILTFPPVAAHPTDVNTVYTAGAGVVYKSTNAAVSWTSSSAFSNRAIKTCQANVNRVYTASVGFGVFRSDDGGTSWSNIQDNGLPSGSITDVNVCPSNSDIVWVTYGGFTTNTKVFYSTNAGVNWQNLSGTLPNLPVNCVYLDASNNAYIGTDIGVYYQANDKVDWTPYYNFLPKVPVTDIYETNGMLRASTFGRGVWECAIYSACDADFTLSGSVSGQKFYQTSNTITSDVNVVGGAGTDVFLKAGNKITLAPGFRIAEQNRLRAYLGPCDAGSVPVFRSSNNSKPTIPLFARMSLPKSETSQYPYGYLNIISAKNNSALIKVNKMADGNFEIKLVDKEGKLIEMEESALGNKKSETTFEISLPNLNQKFYYLQLFYNETLIHFQELHIKS